jgi:hypothetical protein
MVPHHVTTCTLCRLHRGQEPFDLENMNDAFFFHLPLALFAKVVIGRLQMNGEAAFLGSTNEHSDDKKISNLLTFPP